MNISIDEQYEDFRLAIATLEIELMRAVEANCPGPHEVKQKRDMKPPWCRSCGRDDRGNVWAS